MNILNIENLSKSYTDRLLFKEASFFVQEGEKIGVVGINGTGKSTLLRIIAGEEESDSGQVILSKHLILSYLPQNPEFDGDKTILDNISAQTENQTEALKILTGLGILDTSETMAVLSGGQKKKVALAIALSKPADLLLLDEPTNHLDYGMIEWLQGYLNAYRGTIIMVTHDRYFLDEVCNRIVEIDDGSTYSYETNYSGFLERKLAREESIRSSEQKRQNILRREIAWIRRGARARSTKQKAHIARYEELRDREAPKLKSQLSMSSIDSRMGRTTVELEDISKAFEGIKYIQDFTYVFLKDDRIGFIGNNGCGKTTLLKMIAGLVAPDSGTITVGQTIKIGYYSQEVSWMDPDMRVIDYIKETGEYIKTVDGTISASAMLERFLFTSDQQYSPIGKLSGGEKRRLSLLNILMAAPNFLILDEPTNDLDTETLAVLEDYLEHFSGIVVTVSHDRHFLDRVTRRIFAFEGNGQIRQYEGGYTDYLNHASIYFWETDAGKDTPGLGPSAHTTGKTVDSKATWKQEKKLKFTYAEQKEYETIESDISQLEAEIAQTEAEMSKNATSYGKLSELSAKKEELEEALMEKMERWEYLEELAAKIAGGEKS